MKTYNIKPKEWQKPKNVIITNMAVVEEYSNLVVVYKEGGYNKYVRF